jgi:hypothetical protein
MSTATTFSRRSADQRRCRRAAQVANDVTGVGNGSTSEYSGAATSHPYSSGSVTVSYNNSGTDVFPAEMCVRFQYTKAPGVEITPPPGAVENGPVCL